MYHDRSLIAGAKLVAPAVLRFPRGETALPRVMRARTFDAFHTYDAATIDSTGSFLIQQLERLDPTLHMPLVDFQWSRDIDVREDVSIGDETSSFTVNGFGASGGLKGSGKAWIAKGANQLPTVSLDKGKVATPLTEWGMDVSYTIFELESSIRLGTSIDQEKLEALRFKHQMDTDAQVYVGDSVLGLYGLFNLDGRSDSSQVTNVANVATGAAGSAAWVNKAPEEILADVNEVLTSTLNASGFVLMDKRIMLPPVQFGYLATQFVSAAGTRSILDYVLENNILTKNGFKLEFFQSKWLIGRGVSGNPEVLGNVDRMTCYTKARERVRFPMVPLQRTNVQFRSIWQVASYYGKLGGVEAVYPTTIAYRDGI